MMKKSNTFSPVSDLEKSCFLGTVKNSLSTLPKSLFCFCQFHEHNFFLKNLRINETAILYALAEG